MKTRIASILGSLLMASTLSAAEVAPSVEVSYRVLDFYNPGTLLNESNLHVTARNEATDEVYETIDRGQSFSLPAGTYTFSGESNFCFISEVSLEITAQTTSIDLFAGCE